MCRSAAYQRHLVPSWWWAVSRVHSRAAHPSSPPRNTKKQSPLQFKPWQRKRRNGTSGYLLFLSSLERKRDSEITKTKTSSHKNAHMMEHKQGLTLAVVAGCRLLWDRTVAENTAERRSWDRTRRERERESKSASGAGGVVFHNGQTVNTMWPVRGRRRRQVSLKQTVSSEILTLASIPTPWSPSLLGHVTSRLAVVSLGSFLRGRHGDAGQRWQCSDKYEAMVQASLIVVDILWTSNRLCGSNRSVQLQNNR